MMSAQKSRRTGRKRHRAAQAEANQPAGKWTSFMARHETTLILALCILAALRVLVFGAAFPFFNNVDEGAHFDLICKYAAGRVPTQIGHYSREAAERITMTFTQEYYELPPGATASMLPNPLWLDASQEEIDKTLEHNIPHIEKKTNHESTQPPLYYTIAALWFRAGKLLTLDGGHLIYWLKLIDVFVYGLLVWFSYLFAKRFYGANEFIRLGVPLLLVVFPQDVLYSLNNDVLTPLLFGAALYGLLLVHADGSRSIGFHALTGLAVAAAVLTKLTNVPILIILAAIIIMRLRAGAQKTELPRLAVLSMTALVPTAMLLIRNQLVLGDMGGAAAKIERLGWTVKPFSQMWHHPIFTPGGAATFWSGLMKTFWRGEIVWFNEIIASNGMDLLYVLSTTVFLAAAVYGAWKLRQTMAPDSRLASVTGLWVFVLSVGMMAALSIMYDFGDCVYPSNDHPYFTSGRLLSGTLIPFAALYLYGMDLVLRKIGLGGKRWWVLGALVSAVLISEIAISAPAFASLYNWYHMF